MLPPKALIVALKRSLAGVVITADTASPGLALPIAAAAAATTELLVCSVYWVRLMVETVPSAFLIATATLLVFSVPLVAGLSGRATAALLGALVLSELSELLELSVLLELPDVELEAANAVWHIMVHTATLRASAKILFFTSVTSLSKLANSDLSKQDPKLLFQSL